MTGDRVRAFALALALIATLPGCHRVGWGRRDGTQQMLATDKNECKRQFALIPTPPVPDALMPRSRYSRPEDPGKRRRDFMNRCMEERGWSLMELPDRGEQL